VKLLIIDDEPHIRLMIRLTLEAAGYEVDEAADGQAGVDRFGDGAATRVVLDQKMPGMDGSRRSSGSDGRSGRRASDGDGLCVD